MEDHSTIVQHVKQMQKDSASAKQAWWAYCEAFGNNTRDPAAHTTEFLHEFVRLQTEQAAATPAVEKGKDDPAHDELVAEIKLVQKASHEGKLAWHAWCSQQHGMSRDPAVHEDSFLKAFLDSVKTTPPALGEPPAEGSRHAQLVDEIKALQRSPEGKMAWGAWCAQWGNGSRDPAVHDEGFIINFLQAHGLPSAVMYGGGGPGLGMGAMGATSEGALKSQLVEAVKLAQKASEEFRAAWSEYCQYVAGNSRDPSLHDLASLQYVVSRFPLLFASLPMPGVGVGLPRAGPYAGGLPVPKRPRPAPPTDEPTIFANQVRQLLRAGGGWAQKWTAFAASVGSPRADPGHVTPEQLREFLTLHGQTPGQAPAPERPVKPHVQEAAAAVASGEPTHNDLVEVVKAGQSRSEEFKLAWVAHCGRQAQGTRDPSRHTVDSLRAFVEENAHMLSTLVEAPEAPAAASAE